MSSKNGSGLPDTPKRTAEETDLKATDLKRIKTEALAHDAVLDNLFEPLPFEVSKQSDTKPLQSANDFDLPAFLPDTKLSLQANMVSSANYKATGSNNAAQNSAGFSNSTGYTPGLQQSESEQRSMAPCPSNKAAQGTSYLPNIPENMSRVNSTSQLPDSFTLSGAQTPNSMMYQNQQNVGSTYSYQKSATAYPSQYRGPASMSGVPTTSSYKSSTRFDPKKTYSPPTALSGQMPQMPAGMNYNSVPQDKDKAEDPSKLNDALAVSGVDLQREEELLSTNYNRSALNLHQQQLANRQRQSYGQLNAFLHPYHVALFMNRAARENGVSQNFMLDPEMLEFMSSACKEWLSNIVGKTVAMARHRRRGIPAFNPKNKTGLNKQKVVPPSQRSDVSKELRNMALRQKEQEERRVAKRALLGLEKSDSLAPENGNKAGAEETLHRAANATAAMMTLNSSRKKYSWMTSGSDTGGDTSAKTESKETTSKQSSLISARGDNGLRFREIRTGNTITSKDLLSVLEEERVGTAKAVVKGYARLKD